MNQGGLLCCKQTRPKLHGAKREQASQFSQNGAATWPQSHALSPLPARGCPTVPSAICRRQPVNKTNYL